jgi:hypothetical protein
VDILTLHIAVPAATEPRGLQLLGRFSPLGQGYSVSFVSKHNGSPFLILGSGDISGLGGNWPGGGDERGQRLAGAGARVLSC